MSKIMAKKRVSRVPNNFFQFFFCVPVLEGLGCRCYFLMSIHKGGLKLMYLSYDIIYIRELGLFRRSYVGVLVFLI